MEGTERCQECRNRINIELMIITEEEDGPTIYCKGCFNAIQIKYKNANDHIIKNKLKIPLFPVRPLID